jgi:hypothetical protein
VASLLVRVVRLVSVAVLVCVLLLAWRVVALLPVRVGLRSYVVCWLPVFECCTRCLNLYGFLSFKSLLWGVGSSFRRALVALWRVFERAVGTESLFESPFWVRICLFSVLCGLVRFVLILSGFG